MINWLNLFANSLSIFAVSFALAILSYANWEAQEKETKFKDILRQPSKQTYLNIAGFLAFSGMIITADRVGEKIIWATVMLFFLIRLSIMSLSIWKK
ncbi:MAG: hypothetical protein B6I38_00845 [Anaerolineaceae bacterium 4572_5.1]|nr:MAG: hypothetical protein B6I38_00845 [Anaerolineaceae bacterium 4572_5.1]